MEDFDLPQPDTKADGTTSRSWMFLLWKRIRAQSSQNNNSGNSGNPAGMSGDGTADAFGILDNLPIIPGPTGAQGARGLQGIPGIGQDGQDGDMGPPGPAGASGATGSTGPTGASGSIGPPGFDGDSGEDLLRPSPTASPISTLGFRNRLINGDMRIDARNSGAAQTLTAAAAVAYTVDRFYASCTGANVTGQQVAGTGPDQYFYKFTGAASVTGILFGQRIEATNIYDLVSTTVTLSVKLANSLLTTVTWTAYSADVTDVWSAKTPIATGTFTITSTITQYIVQIDTGANASKGVAIEFTVGAQTSGTWTIGEVQIETGVVAASVFERRPITVEDSLCRRYLPSYNIPTTERIFGGAGSTTLTYFYLPFTVPARIAPTGIATSTVGNFQVFSTGSGGAGAATAIAYTAAGLYAGTLQTTTTAGTPVLVAGVVCFLFCSSASQILFTGAEL